MKIALPVLTNAGLDSPLSPNFGRAAFFAIVEVNGDKIGNVEFVQNPGFNAVRSAGIMASQLLLDKGVNAVIAFQVGPNAYSVLTAAGVKLYSAVANTVKENVQRYLEGSLPSLVSKGFGRGFGWGRRWGWR